MNILWNISTETKFKNILYLCSLQSTQQKQRTLMSDMEFFIITI